MVAEASISRNYCAIIYHPRTGIACRRSGRKRQACCWSGHPRSAQCDGFGASLETGATVVERANRCLHNVRFTFNVRTGPIVVENQSQHQPCSGGPTRVQALFSSTFAAGCSEASQATLHAARGHGAAEQDGHGNQRAAVKRSVCILENDVVIAGGDLNCLASGRKPGTIFATSHGGTVFPHRQNEAQ